MEEIAFRLDRSRQEDSQRGGEPSSGSERISNAASQPQADAVPDGRGMAIKVLGVEGDVVLADEQRGPTQDFVIINHPMLFARNVKDYLRLEQVLVQADDSALATLKGGLSEASQSKVLNADLHR